MKKIVLIEDDADLFALLQVQLRERRLCVCGGADRQGSAGPLPPREAGPHHSRHHASRYRRAGDLPGIRAHPDLAHVPVIFLTAKGSETDRIVGLELGANDYIVKPFFIRELIARVKIQFRDKAATPKVLKAGSLELDGTSYHVRLGGKPVTLTATEFKLLEYLMSRPGAVFSRDQLLDAVWGPGRSVTNRTVDVYILRLRQKIEEDPANPRYIHSVRGFGYSFSSEPFA